MPVDVVFPITRFSKDLNTSERSFLQVDDSFDLALGSHGKFNHKYGAYFLHDLDLDITGLIAGPVTGDYCYAARLELTMRANSVPGFPMVAEIYSMDPTANRNEWYLGTTKVQSWRGNHLHDLRMEVWTNPSSPVMQTKTEARAGNTPSPLPMRNEGPAPGATLGPFDQVAQYQHLPADGELDRVEVFLRQFGDWIDQKAWVELWTAVAVGGGKYNLSPGVKLAESFKETIFENLPSIIAANHPFHFPTGINLVEGPYIWVMQTDYEVSPGNYIDYKAISHLDGDAETVGGHPGALLTRGQDLWLGPGSYFDNFTIEDVCTLESGNYVILGSSVAGDVVNGGINADIFALVNTAMARAAWDANPLFGVHLDTNNTQNGFRAFPAYFNDATYDPPQIKLSWAPQPNGTIDTPAAPVEIFQFESVNFTGSGSDGEGGTMAFDWDFDAGSGSGVPGSSLEDPGAIEFPVRGVFTVTLTVSNATYPLAVDLTPATVVVTVLKPSSKKVGMRNFALGPVTSATMALGATVSAVPALGANTSGRVSIGPGTSAKCAVGPKTSGKLRFA